MAEEMKENRELVIGDELTRQLKHTVAHARIAKKKLGILRDTLVASGNPDFKPLIRVLDGALTELKTALTTMRGKNQEGVEWEKNCH